MEDVKTAPVAETPAASENVTQTENSTPDVPALETAPEAPAAVEESTVDTQPTVVADQTENDRVANAIKEVEKKNAAYRRVVDLQARIVADNPELIHAIAKSDPDIANQVVDKVWGDKGIRSYKQLAERAKLEELRESNPALYETKLEMSEIKAELESRRMKELSEVKDRFLKEKGILENEYDPKYNKLLEALDLVNPAVIEKDFRGALETAHQIAFSKGLPRVPVQQPTSGSVGGGQPSDVMPSAKPPVNDQTLWLAQGLSKIGGYDIKF